MAKVVILGGGIGGLSAAHELVERGFQVSVYERRDDWGGKARSYDVPASGTQGRRNLPAEHGFRLFPGFYKHLPDTMKRIPFRDNACGVFDNLVPTSRMEVARETAPPSVTSAHFPRTLEEWMGALESMFSFQGISSEEARFFAGRALVALTSCQERRLAEYERYSWWQFVEADGKSEAYQRLLGDGLIRRIFAVQGREASARTMANTGIQVLLDEISPGRGPLRVLNGPQNEVWIDPWVSYLRQRGVQLCPNASLQRLDFEEGRVRSATVRVDGKDVEIEGDYYVCAVPVEVMRRLATAELMQAVPTLAHLDQLHTVWKVGIQFYLKRDVPVLPGYVVYADSNWGLLSLSQHQFWSGVQLSDYGSGEVQGILSVDICDWHTPGDKVVSKPADQCTADEIAAEVWAQIKAHLNRDGQQPLQDADLLAWHLDTSIRFPPTLPQDERNAEPLLMNTAGSWQYRPEADLSNGLFREIPNLFLAADYVRTYTDAATMEGANEAARRAVNAILVASGSRAQPCGVWPLEEPALFAPFRAYDYTRFKLGYPHALPALAQVKKGLPALGRLTGGRERLRELNHYQFEERWRVEAPREAVWPLVAEPTTYPDWWGQYPKVRRLNSLQGVGASWEMQIQFTPGVPYRLRFVIELVRREEPSIVQWRARGDLSGHVGFTLEETGTGTVVNYRSNLQTGKLLLKTVSPVVRPFFLWNHEAMMRRGEEELRAELARRTARLSR